MKRGAARLFLCALAGFCGTLRPAVAQEPPTALYAGRTIDLTPYLGLGISSISIPPTPGGELYFRQTTEDRIALRAVPLSALRAGTLLETRGARDVLPGIDLARRWVTPPRHDSVANLWYVRADTANDEHRDVYRMDVRTGEMERLTDDGYVMSASGLGGYMAYAARVGAREPYGQCLHLMTIVARVPRTIACNDSTTTYGWNALWRPDARAFVLPVRTRGAAPNLALFEIRGDSAMLAKLLLPQDTLRGAVTALEWTGADALRVMMTVDGVRNLYELHALSGAITPVTHLRVRGQWLEAPPLSRFGGHTVAVLRQQTDDGIRLVIYDAERGRRLGSGVIDNGYTIGPGGGAAGDGSGAWLLARESVTSRGVYDVLQLVQQGDSLAFMTRPLLRPTAAAQRGLQACNIERVSYETFDRRTIHGFLHTPRTPPPPAETRLAIVIAFYGGRDMYHPHIALWCDAGITVFSPAPRGSYTQDDEFAMLTHGDRGGDEIVDILYGARWLAHRLGLPPRHIGVYGMSRGGYNALQALTHDRTINQRNASFDFGFGIAEAGYSSLLTILHNTNTESPEIIATGDPSTEAGRQRLRARSPLDQVARLNAPLLLIHGTNDYRVQIEESRQMRDAATRAGKDVALLEVPGEGHGIQGVHNLMLYYRAQLDFLDRIRQMLDEAPGRN